MSRKTESENQLYFAGMYKPAAIEAQTAGALLERVVKAAGEMIPQIAKAAVAHSKKASARIELAVTPRTKKDQATEYYITVIPKVTAMPGEKLEEQIVVKGGKVSFAINAKEETEPGEEQTAIQKSAA